jgi:hypothetical protein
VGEHYDCIEVPREEQVARLIAERDEARAEVERRREQMDAERAVFDAFADLQRVKLESARAEVARLRLLALVPMAPIDDGGTTDRHRELRDNLSNIDPAWRGEIKALLDDRDHLLRSMREVAGG